MIWNPIDTFFYRSIFKYKKIKNLVYEPKLIEIPLGQRILALAPHFDDAAIGCGGTLHKHSVSGDKVTTVYITDGSKGIPSIKNKEKILQIRSKEARNAMDLLGVKNIVLLNQSECKIKINKIVIKKLSSIIKKINPDLIYLPWFLDNHMDHIATNKLLYKCFKLNNFDFNVCAYEVWTPLIPNLIVDIGPVINIKKKAISCFKSQIKQIDYLSTTMGINKYRSCYNLLGKSYAEVFLYMKAKDYFKLFIK